MLPLFRSHYLFLTAVFCGLLFLVHEFNVLEHVRQLRPTQGPVRIPLHDHVQIPVHDSIKKPSDDLIADPTHDSAPDPVRNPTTILVHSSTPDPKHNSVKDPLDNDILGPLEDSVTDHVQNSTLEPVHDSALDPVHDSIKDPVHDPVHDPVQDSVHNSTSDSISDFTEDSPEDSTPKPVHNSTQNSVHEYMQDPVHDPTSQTLNEYKWSNRTADFPVSSYIPLPSGKPASIPRIQYRPRKENEAFHVLRTDRQRAVKKSFAHAWHAYKMQAWLKDEVLPLNGNFTNSFGGRAATLVDTLDTLWIMGLKEEFWKALKALDHIDFSTTELNTLNLFETTIRYLGGLLAAYDISGQQYPSLIDKAVVLGDFLYKAFDTPNRMPITRWEWKKSMSGAQSNPGRMIVSEIGSLSLEFTRLSQITNDPKYYDAIQRISDRFEEAQNSTQLPGMWPVIVDSSQSSFGAYNTFTYGGMSDSTYEYLPKQHMLLGGLSPQYRSLYEASLESAKKHLLFKPMNPKNLDILLAGNAKVLSNGTVQLDPEGQHLTCFAGGMIAIAGKIFNEPKDVAMAAKMVKGCLWAYNSMPTGLMPETFHAVPCANSTCTWNATTWYEAIYKRHDIPSQIKNMTKGAFVKKIIAEERLQPGFTAIGDRRYILRPELVESIFILYRITGDRYWQEEAWKLFNAIEKHTKTKTANAALDDVTLDPPPQSNRMESFWLAETLKYFYLIFSEFDVVSLDEYVLNTEAHPFKRP